jgi:hypothetical protein
MTLHSKAWNEHETNPPIFKATLDNGDVVGWIYHHTGSVLYSAFLGIREDKKASEVVREKAG